MPLGFGKARSNTKDRSESNADADRPKQPELDKLLNEMLDAQGQPPAVRKKIMELSDSNKWEMCKGYQAIAAQKRAEQEKAMAAGIDKGDIKDTPEHWIQVLNLEPSRSNLEELSVMLRQQAVSWVDDFIALSGVIALTDLLELLEKKAFKKPGDFEMMGQVLRCLRSLMNLENGMDEILGTGEGSKGGLKQLARCIDTKHESVAARTVQCQALTLLSAAALYSADGHDQARRGPLHRPRPALPRVPSVMSLSSSPRLTVRPPPPPLSPTPPPSPSPSPSSPCHPHPSPFASPPRTTGLPGARPPQKGAAEARALRLARRGVQPLPVRGRGRGRRRRL